MDMDTFIEDLIKTQRHLKATDREMAARIGCTRQWYMRIRRRQDKPGVNFIRGAAREFSWLRKCAIGAIMASGNKMGGELAPTTQGEKVDEIR